MIINQSKISNLDYSSLCPQKIQKKVKSICQEVFFRLMPQDLATCARVCSSWNAAQDANFWYLYLRSQYGSIVSACESQILALNLSWKEAYRFLPLLRFFSNLSEAQIDERAIFSGDCRFFINAEKKAIGMARELNTIVTEFEGVEGERLVSLTGSKQYLFGLHESGLIVQWHARTGEIYKVFETSLVRRNEDLGISQVAKGSILFVENGVITLYHKNTPYLEVIDCKKKSAPSSIIRIENLKHARHLIKMGNVLLYITEDIETEKHKIWLFELSSRTQHRLFSMSSSLEIYVFKRVGMSLYVLGLDEYSEETDSSTLMKYDFETKQLSSLDLPSDLPLKNATFINDFLFLSEKLEDDADNNYTNVAVVDLISGDVLDTFEDVLCQENPYLIQEDVAKSLLDYFK